MKQPANQPQTCQGAVEQYNKKWFPVCGRKLNFGVFEKPAKTITKLMDPIIFRKDTEVLKIKVLINTMSWIVFLCTCLKKPDNFCNPLAKPKFFL